MKTKSVLQNLKSLQNKTKMVSLHLNRCQKYFKTFFRYGDIRDKTKAHNVQRVALLRIKDRQTEPFKLSVPRRQNPELPGLLQDTDGILL